MAEGDDADVVTVTAWELNILGTLDDLDPTFDVGAYVINFCELFVPLERKLILMIPDDNRLQHAMPFLTLGLALHTRTKLQEEGEDEDDGEQLEEEEEYQREGPKRISTALEAFGALAKISQLMSGYPYVKIDFWQRVLRSPIMLLQSWGAILPWDDEYNYEQPKIYLNEEMLCDAAFPHFEMNLIGFMEADEKREAREKRNEPIPIPLSTELIDHLCKFMTIPPKPSSVLGRLLAPLSPELVPRITPEKVRFGFKLDRCMLTAPCLTLLQSFFDRVFVQQ